MNDRTLSYIYKEKTMLGEALRLLRVYHDLNQTEAATKLGISKSYLSEIENKNKIPTIALLEKYSSAFDVPVSQIMYFSETMHDNTSLGKASKFTAGKILKLMQFIEARSQ
jgi:transcriptional regulator with XRE-family HTH domain